MIGSNIVIRADVTVSDLRTSFTAPQAPQYPRLAFNSLQFHPAEKGCPRDCAGSSRGSLWKSSSEVGTAITVELR
jgi:hypothetical protein